MAPRLFKIGTRTSLLAWRQSEMMRDLIQKHHPTAQVALHGIQTRGDQIQDRPLTELEGKDFFVAELDKALIAGETDLTVHSLKDLSTERPAELYLAAIPPRYTPHDVLIFAPDIFSDGRLPSRLVIGTGSPRRKSCIEHHLPDLLPQAGEKPQVSCTPIRGNVETRLKRLYEPSERFPRVDGVVLALAGLERLWAHPKTRAILGPLLQSTHMMVLPLPLFPTAPGQAALAIECRSDDEETKALLKALHCNTTAQAVGRERALLSAMGGGCHLPLGATSFSDERFNEFMWSSVPDEQNQVVSQVMWQPAKALPPLPVKLRAVDGVLAKSKVQTDAPVLSGGIPSDACVFVSHQRALPDSLLRDPQHRRFWVPGVGTWRKLAAKGLLVSGCTDNLGWRRMGDLTENSLLDLPQAAQWHVLTHEQALGWSKSGATVHFTYAFEKQNDLEFKKQLENATHVFWGSASQFFKYHEACPREAHHACGPGKTADRLAEVGLEHYTVFPSRAQWQTWVSERQKN